MSKNEITFTIEECNHSIQRLAGRSDIGEELKKRIASADAVLVPDVGYGDREDLEYFPAGTQQLFHFLRNTSGDEQVIEICTEESDYKELALHADLVIIAGLIATLVAAPVVANLVSEYILRSLGRRTAETTVKSSLTVEDKNAGRSFTLKFEGPASEYRSVMLRGIRNLPELIRSEAADLEPRELKEEEDELHNARKSIDSKLS